jgi:competence protein ComEA
MAAIARHRLELLTAELAGIRSSLPPDPDHADLPTDSLAEESLLGRQGAAQPSADPRPEVAEPEPRLGDWERPTRGRGRHARRPVAASGRVGGWVHDRLPPTLQGRVRLTAGHLSVVALLVAAAFAVTAWWVVRAEGSATVVPAATWSEIEAAEPSVDTPLVTPAAEPVAATETEPAVVVVDVAGKVRRPGIATLPLGSRVVDALEAAGGVRRGVDLTTLNLARVLVDGEQIVVGLPQPAGVAAPAASAPGGSAAGVMVNLNAASQSELEELPGVGPVTAAAILQWRTDNGPFTSVDELLEVSGIGDATLAEIAPFVTL